jgi:hypothetical protein
MTCRDLVVEGENSTVQFAFVVMSGAVDVARVQFGARYSSAVDVTSWTLCATGSELAEAAWPDSGSGNAVAWSSPQSPSGPDSLTTVGYFTVDSGSTGTLRLQPDPRTGTAEYTSSEGVVKQFSAESGLGFADMDRGGGGYNPCGFEINDRTLAVVFASGVVQDYPVNAAGRITTLVPLSSVTLPADLNNTLVALDVTHIRKVLRCEEGDTVQVSTARRRVPKSQVPRIRSDDPEWNVSRHIAVLEAKGVNVTETSTTLELEFTTQDTCSAELTQMYSLYFTPSTSPYKLRSVLEGFTSEVEQVRYSGVTIRD